MLNSLNRLWNSQRAKQLFDVRNVGLYIFSIIVLAIAWGGVKTVQANYELQKKISVLRQQNAVLHLQNQNTALQNQYLQTDQYLELSARQAFGLAAPGEKVLLIPKNVAMKYVNPAVGPETAADNNLSPKDTRSGMTKNLQAWRDFLLGRKLFDD